MTDTAREVSPEPVTFTLADGDQFTVDHLADPCADKARDYKDAVEDLIAANNTLIAANENWERAHDELDTAEAAEWSSARVGAQKAACAIKHPLDASARAQCREQVDAEARSLRQATREKRAEAHEADHYRQQAKEQKEKAENEKERELQKWKDCQEQHKHEQDGCGSRGGPGYMTHRHKCASWKDVEQAKS